MILFHTIPNIGEFLYQLILNGNIPYKNIIHYTLFGGVQLGDFLHLLPDDAYIPTEFILNDSESNFDYYYWKQLQDDSKCFSEKMKLLEPEYLDGANNIILIQTQYDSQTKISITESFMGYLKVFYGLDPKLIMSIEDIQESIFTYNGFSPEGLYRLSGELERKYQGGD